MTPDIAEAQFAQGDLARAIRTILQYRLPLTQDGAAECERIMWENGEGNTRLWVHPRYLRTTIHMAQGVLEGVQFGGAVP